MSTPITWNATDIAAGVRDIRGKWVNSPYLRNGSVEWNPLTPSFLNDGNGWQTSECPVIVRAPRLATQAILFVNGVAWDVHGSTSIAAAQNELLVSHPNASPVEGIVLEGRESQVLYRDAITDGIDLAVGIWHGRGPRAEHIYVIRRMPSGDSEFVEIESLVTAVGSRVAGWDGASLLEIGNTSIVDRQDDRRGWTLRPAVAWYYDADGVMVKIPIVARMEYLSRGNVKVTKFVPRSLIATALMAREGGELRCDLTGTFYPDANPETTTHDGYVKRSATESWVTKMAGTGTAVDDSSVTAYSYLSTFSSGNSWVHSYRGQYGFDLASLSGATISNCTLTLRGTGGTLTTLAGQSISLTAMTPASWTGVSTGDFQGHAASAVRLCSDVALSSISGSADNAFAFNPDGVTAIQAAAGGRFMASVKYASETDGLEPTWAASKTASAQFVTAENGNSTLIPRLAVTYTLSGGSSSGSLLLLGVG